MAKKDGKKKADKADRDEVPTPTTSSNGVGRGEDTGSAATPTAATPTDVSAPVTPSDGGSHARVDVDTTTPVTALTEPGGGATAGAAPGSQAPVTVTTPTPVEALATPAGRGRPAATTPASRADAPVSHTPLSDLADQLGEAFLAPLRVARRVLPTDRAPVVLGVAALALVGVLEWPAAVAAGLGYEALRRWSPADDRPQGR